MDAISTTKKGPSGRSVYTVFGFPILYPEIATFRGLCFCLVYYMRRMFLLYFSIFLLLSILCFLLVLVSSFYWPYKALIKSCMYNTVLQNMDTFMLWNCFELNILKLHTRPNKIKTKALTHYHLLSLQILIKGITLMQFWSVSQ